MALEFSGIEKVYEQLRTRSLMPPTETLNDHVTHPVRVNAVHLPELVETPLGSSDKRRRTLKLLHFCDRDLCWLLVGH